LKYFALKRTGANLEAGRAGSARSGVSGLVFVSRVVIDELFLVLANSPFELVYETIDGGIHIFFDVIAIDGAAVHAGSGFRLMLQFLDGQNTFDVRHDVKVSADLIDLCADVIAHGFSNFDMMA
jgi:hypothetical protein